MPETRTTEHLCPFCQNPIATHDENTHCFSAMGFLCQGYWAGQIDVDPPPVVPEDHGFGEIPDMNATLELLRCIGVDMQVLEQHKLNYPEPIWVAMQFHGGQHHFIELHGQEFNKNEAIMPIIQDFLDAAVAGNLVWTIGAKNHSVLVALDFGIQIEGDFLAGTLAKAWLLWRCETFLNQIGKDHD